MVEIRLANRSDLHNVMLLNVGEYWDDREIWKNSSQHTRWQQGLWWVDPELLSWHFGILQQADGNIIIAIDDGKIVGELDFVKSVDHLPDFDGYRLHIIWIVVHSNYRRQGIATAMIKFLTQLSDDPIWVEPEDKRSTQLYQNLGKQIYSISNWSVSLDHLSGSHVRQSVEYQVSSYEVIHRHLDEYMLLFGRYYAPKYDLCQLSGSEPVMDLMWGNTGGAKIHHYQLNNTRVYAIMTQYPRIWVSKFYEQADLLKILTSISLYLLESGFDELFMQIYNETNVGHYLDELGYFCTIEADPVYCLSG